MTKTNAAIANAQDGGDKPNGPKEGEIYCTCDPGCKNGKICDPGVGQSNCQCVCQGKPETYILAMGSVTLPPRRDCELPRTVGVSLVKS